MAQGRRAGVWGEPEQAKRGKRNIVLTRNIELVDFDALSRMEVVLMRFSDKSDLLGK